MQTKPLNELKWWIKTSAEVLGTTLIAFAPEILQLFPQHTLAFKLAIPIGFFLKTMKLRKEYQDNKLPSGIIKAMDKIPVRFTGVRVQEEELQQKDEEGS